MSESKSKVWWDEANQIGRLEMPVTPDESELDEIFRKVDEINNKLPEKVKWLVKPADAAPSAKDRKIIAARFYNNPKIEKHAVLTGSALTRVTVGFLMKASGVKNVKFFAVEAEALKWLKDGE